MYKVLVFGLTENSGGVESFLLNYYRKIDKSKIHFDFLCNTYNEVAYEEEIKSLGGKVIHIAMRKKNPIKFYKELNEFLKIHAADYDAVWVNVCSLANIDYLKAAKKYGIRKRIIHSHNSRNMDSKARNFLHYINRKRIKHYATDFWACSNDAAKWFYKKELLPKAVLIKNAIELERVKFSEEKREKNRKELHITDRLVIGNVGRLHFQKNQKFAFQVIKYLSNMIPNCVLLLVGQGEDENELRQEAKRLKIQDNVIFAGLQTDIGGYLSAFDLFLFPSIFEGLSLASIEAQVNGLPSLSSYGVVPNELKLTNNFKFKRLEDGPESWANEIRKMSFNLKRTDYEKIKELVTKAGFNIDTEVSRLEYLLMGIK